MLARGLDGFGIHALLGREWAANQQVVHAQHAIHGRADLVTHGGQKFALGPICGLGSLFGLAQLGGSQRHLVFQVVPVHGQAALTVGNMGQHRVEALRQFVQLGDVAALGCYVVVVPACHMLHQVIELVQRHQHGAVQPAQQQHAGPQCQRCAQQRGEQLPGCLLIQAAQADPQDKPAGFVTRAVDPLGQHDLMCLQHPPLGGCFQSANGRFPLILVAGEQGLLARIQTGGQHRGRVLQRGQEVFGRPDILKHQRCAGVFCQDPGLHTAAVDQSQKPQQGTADQDDHSDQAQGGQQGQAIDTAQAGTQRDTRHH